MRELAKRQELPASELIRRAMDEYLDRHYVERGSVRNLPRHRTGGIRRIGKGSQIFEEMTRR